MRGPGVRTWLRGRRGGSAPTTVNPTEIDRFAASRAEIVALRASAASDLERLFYDNSGRTVHKWTHYLPAYAAHFERFRGTDVGMLEIGVFQGGSLDLWRRYFGDAARIVGIDIDPACAERVSAPNRVEIGSQADPEFLTAAVGRLGRLDLVLDDGSHVGEHQWASFTTLFPLLEPGGLYVIEDLHTSYWDEWDGAHDRTDTGIGLVKQLIDDLHGWYHEEPTPTPARDWVPALHVYDSVVFIEKQARRAPQHAYVDGAGGGAS